MPSTLVVNRQNVHQYRRCAVRSKQIGSIPPASRQLLIAGRPLTPVPTMHTRKGLVALISVRDFNILCIHTHTATNWQNFNFNYELFINENFKKRSKIKRQQALDVQPLLDTYAYSLILKMHRPWRRNQSSIYYNKFI